MHLPGEPRDTGFTLVELIVVLVTLGILSAYAVGRFVSSGELSLPSQAQKMARDIDSAKTLAYTQGARMLFSVTPGLNGAYSVLCQTSCTTTGGVTTCVAPATPCTTNFSVNVQLGVTLAGPASLYFNGLGQPLADSAGTLAASATSYTLRAGSSTETISVAAQTGVVTVSP